MDDNDNAGFLEMRGAHTFIASKLAPKGAAMNRPVKTTSRPQLALQSYLDSLLMERPKNCRLKFKRLLKSSKLSKRLVEAAG
jgi:hypothetical protein